VLALQTDLAILYSIGVEFPAGARRRRWSLLGRTSSPAALPATSAAVERGEAA
jgi:hypothetical protein